MPDLKWTRFSNAAAVSAHESAQEWPDLINHLRSAGPYSSKAACPWIKLARFGVQRSGKGSLRHDGNLLAIYGVEGDYDGEQIQPEEAIALLERAQIKAAVYTSPSHRPEAPRWRVLAPLSHEHPVAERNTLLARINGALGGVLSGESFTLSQSYYYGRVQGQTDYRVLVTFDDPDDGVYIDEANDLDAIAIAKTPRVNGHESGNRTEGIAAKVEALGRRLRTGDGRRELLKAYISDKSNRGLTDDEIRVLVDDVVSRFFDSGDPIDWGNVGSIITSIAEADAKHRAEVRETVGEFVDGLEFKSRAATGAGIDFPFLDLAGLQASAASITWLVKHVIPADSVGVMFGGSGTFKSFIALDMALHIAHGMPWMGKKTKKGAVVFIAAEGGAGLWRRVEAWHKERGLDWKGLEFYVVPVAIELVKDSKRVVEAAKALGVTPALVVIDTLSQTFSGEENSANEMSGYLRAIGLAFRALWKACVLVIHHSGHAATERPRGSSAIRSNVDYMLGVFRDEKEMLASVECVKQKDGELFSQSTFSMTSVRLGVDEDGDAITSLAARHLNGVEELAEAVKTNALAGRGGRYTLLLGLIVSGMTEKELRKAFYEDLSEVAEIEKKKVAFYRARDRAIADGFIEIKQDSAGERRVLLLREVN